MLRVGWLMLSSYTIDLSIVWTEIGEVPGTLWSLKVGLIWPHLYSKKLGNPCDCDLGACCHPLSTYTVITVSLTGPYIPSRYTVWTKYTVKERVLTSSPEFYIHCFLFFNKMKKIELLHGYYAHLSPIFCTTYFFQPWNSKWKKFLQMCSDYYWNPYV